MRFLIVLLILCCASVEAFSQDDQPKYTYLNMTEMSRMVAVKDFRGVPYEVRDIHAQGSVLVHVRIDSAGQPVRAAAFKSDVGKYDILREYAAKAVSNWTFKPLLIDGRPVAYRGYVLVFFWYGSFLENESANTSGPSDLLHSTRQ